MDIQQQFSNKYLHDNSNNKDLSININSEQIFKTQDSIINNNNNNNKIKTNKIMTDSVVDISTKTTADSGESNESNSSSSSSTVNAKINENDKENDNIDVVVDDNSNSNNKVMNSKEQKNESQIQKLSNNEFDWYKQYEDKILSQAQAHRNAVLAASLQYLKPIERERFFAQFNGFNNNSGTLLIPQNRILTPPPSSSSSSSQQNISPQSSSSSSSSSSTNEGLPNERYYAPYQTTNIYNNKSNEQEKLVAAHTQALLAQYAAQQFYQSHATNFQNHPTVAPPSVIAPPKMDKDRQPFNIYNPINITYYPPSSNTATNANTSSQKLGVSASTSSISIDDQRASPHTNSYDEDDAASGINGDEGDNQSLNDTNGEWTYEEQFKQLYELSDDTKRKEFLDELFAFMQKRGSPVNRIPIMAKHVLDLYELYKLVIAKGGLVEVINKKLWREITKGLNLPSSITSAAFTLRTQYMKYLYPYECEKLKLSSPQELQTAIDGNRREGRRPAYGFEYASPNGMNSTNGLLLPHPVNTNQIDYSAHHHHHQHHAFLAAAAAAAAAASGHPPQPNQPQPSRPPPLHLHHHPLFDPTNLNVNTTTHLSHYQMQAAVAAAAASPGNMGIQAFLKPYLDANLQQSNGSMMHSREGLIIESNHNNNQQISDETNIHYNRHLGSIHKRSLETSEHHQQLKSDEPENLTNPMTTVNKTINEGSNEPPAKKILTEQHQNSNNKSESKITKIKVLPNKELTTNDLVNVDKTIKISLEINGVTYQGILVATTENKKID